MATTRIESAVKNAPAPEVHSPQAQDLETAPTNSPETTNSPKPTNHLAALGGDPRSQLLHLRKHLEFQTQDRFEKTRIDWATVIDRNQSRRHITRDLHVKINLKATTLTGQDFYQTGRANKDEALDNMDKMTFMVRSRGKIEAKMGVDRHLSWNTRYRIFRSRYRHFSDEIFWEMMAEDHHRTIAPKRNGFPMEIQIEMLEREQARKDLLQYNRRLRELISTQGGNPDQYKKAVIRTMRYCYTCSQLHTHDPHQTGDDPYQRCPDCQNQLGPKREFASLIGEWPRIVSVKELLSAPTV